jgi:DNA-directed RNA polymerase specialized sigma24 family protein
MKIKYKFADGTVSEVEVDDEFGEQYLTAQRLEENYERKTRYWVKASLDTLDYEGEWFKDPNPTPLEKVIIDEERKESEKKVQAFYSTLTERQLRRTLMLQQGFTQRGIAEIEGVNLNAIQKSIEQVKKKHIEFFCK